MLSVIRPVTEAAADWPSLAARWQQIQDWTRRNPQTALWLGGGAVVLALLILLIADWKPYRKHHEAFAPLLTLAAGLAVAGVTLMRHFAQTEADSQRRITESFSRAIEQLGSDKLEVRLGGIYALERISQESPRDYWTVMETLTAFVRESTQRTEAERMARPREQRLREHAHRLWEQDGSPDGHEEEFWARAIAQERYGDPLATDIAAVLTVIKRRGEEDRAREVSDNRVFRKGRFARCRSHGSAPRTQQLLLCVSRRRQFPVGAYRRRQVRLCPAIRCQPPSGAY